ncbi:flagellar assembly peptidoglycan hydrolase FlgJ [Paraburkholderia caballeronis]|uniref:Peptidoglycan hydrolase FlgJ n=1 Tax=Paraburkholderia caballeronis TaxID=416943 RepID=A0A1H7SLL8_9BURK|nr:flagellar assembly peptidoglycan hydrolase FlgJ [Paraburkholderia caballeronis]PXW22369.1 flagellar protein FlgJ [Paraburkholderia caballeronis]PXW96027.1 flagellar protein FlgJ [Paraburkholderia caballeronis]RAJ92393.1 flagellar protein FlgJ [Paraburkholderia caballeronis]TDV08062.1 flagellar protein FlgJ [Paraburkholderia caballeronis]TDV11874.1 flagellar protein FlgJ [Paraburkholderia caballeronis]
MDNSKVTSSLDLTNRFALDVQGFDALRAAANAAPQQGVKMAAKQFDAVFTQMMLKSMRDATPSDSPFDSHDGDTFTSMLDQQMSQQMSSKGIGVADAMIKQLTRSMGGGADGMGGGASAGNLKMLDALGRAYGNSAANGALASGSGYGANSALTPPLRGNGDSPDTDAFVDKLAGAAQQASASTGIPARFIVGQAALESGWGKREIRHADGSTSHNVFGIKATRGWTGKTVTATTTEYVNGQAHRVQAKFRAYDSYDDAMADYASMLKNNPRYASVITGSRSAEGFAQGMQRAGYATDPHYAKKLMSIMQQMV